MPLQWYHQYKKDLHDPDNHDGMITHLEPDILEREVKWALESITTNKASGGDGIPVELFQILKDDAVKVLHSICQQIWKTLVLISEFPWLLCLLVYSTPLQHSCLGSPMDGGAWCAAVHGVAGSWTRLSDFTFTFRVHALEKEMATHSSVLVWRIPRTGEPGGLPSMASHRVGHNWSDLAAVVAAVVATRQEKVSCHSNPKERQCQRMFKLPHNFTDLTC